jgi:hypothetical protein
MHLLKEYRSLGMGIQNKLSNIASVVREQSQIWEGIFLIKILPDALPKIWVE